MIEINEQLSIREEELDLAFIRSSGPGGQHVNRSATAVQLRFDAAESSSLPPAVFQRLKRIAGQRMTSDGVVIIEASSHRSQQQNREDAVERLVALLRQAARRPKVRKATRPSRSAKERRLQQKKQRSQIKKLRRYDPRREA